MVIGFSMKYLKPPIHLLSDSLSLVVKAIE